MIKSGTTLKCSNDLCNKEIYIKKCVYDKNTNGIFCCSKQCNYSDSVKIKRKNNFIEKYGVENNFQRPKIKQKIKNTNLERYGVENPFQSEIVKQKIKNTNLERYGVENPNQNKEICANGLKTRTDNFIKNNIELLGCVPLQKTKKTCLEKYGNEIFFKSNYGKMNLEGFILREGKELGLLKYIETREKITKKSLLTNSQNSKRPRKFFLNLLENIEDKSNLEFEFLLYDKELNKHYSYDFRYKNKLIEFQGDYWHGNPKIYSYNDIINFPGGKQIQVKDLWKKDKVKKKLAKKNGYDFLAVWEQDINNNFEKIIKKVVKFLGE